MSSGTGIDQAARMGRLLQLDRRLPDRRARRIATSAVGLWFLSRQCGQWRQAGGLPRRREPCLSATLMGEARTNPSSIDCYPCECKGSSKMIDRRNIARMGEAKENLYLTIFIHVYDNMWTY